jgi:hypothetical protein
MLVPGYTVHENSSGLVVGWRKTAAKAFDLADSYAPRDMNVLFGKMSLEAILEIERCEAGRLRSPIALQLHPSGWPSMTVQVVSSSLEATP